MYKFTDLKQPADLRSRIISTEVDGILLDSKIPNFRTLTVAGREGVGRDIESRNYRKVRGGGRDRTSGIKSNQNVTTNKIISSVVQSRIITVTYEIDAETDYKSRRQWEMLNNYVNKEEARLRFTDDWQKYYIGTLINVGEVNPASNRIVSHLEYECMDPFKYAVLADTWEYSSKKVVFMQTSMWPVVIERLEIDNIVNNLQIGNRTTGQIITLYGNHRGVIFDFKENLVKSKSGQNLLSQLDIMSDFENFELNFEDEIWSNQEIQAKWTYRRRWL